MTDAARNERPSLPPARLISFQVSLLVAISLLMTAAGASIIGNSYVRSRAIVNRIASRLFHEVSEQAVVQTRERLGSAVPVVELLGGRMRDGLLPRGGDPLARELLEVLRANPAFTWVSYGDAAGAFTGAYRTDDGRMHVNLSARTAGHNAVTVYDVDDAGHWTLARTEQNDYDPRTRPWYRQAAEARRRVWTPPYVFFHEAVPGVTCALPDLAPDGTVRGVFTIDFDLNNLSSFAARMHPTPHGRVFLFTRSGTMLAHPSERVVRGSSPETAALVNVSMVRDPMLHGFFDDARHRHSLGPFPHGNDFDEEFSFRSGNGIYLASYNSFQIDDGVDWVVGIVAPTSDLMQGVHRANETSLLLSLAALVVALAVGAVLARRIAEPLTRLTSEMELVGEFDVDERPMRLTVLREIAMANRALASMKRGLRSFASYVPRDLVRAVLASGTEARLGGTTRTLTVYFSDLEGFTTLAEALAPDELVRFLGRYFEEMAALITASHGTIDKFIGDAVMAFWGAPEDVPDHAARACEAALRCHRRLMAMQADDPSARPLHARIGISTGDVLVGNIGTRERMNYTVMGDSVNLASRLEGLGKQYGTSILVSEETFRAAQTRVIARPVDLVAVKGKARGVKVYELLALAEDDDAAARETAERSDDAFAAYLERDFAKAVTLFEKVLTVRPGDRAATMLRDRCKRFVEQPPGDDWNGVHVSHEK